MNASIIASINATPSSTMLLHQRCFSIHRHDDPSIDTFPIEFHPSPLNPVEFHPSMSKIIISHSAINPGYGASPVRKENQLPLLV